jgi:hypothetical protein
MLGLQKHLINVKNGIKTYQNQINELREVKAKLRVLDFGLLKVR